MVKPEEVGISSQRLKRIQSVIESHIGEEKIAGAITLIFRRGELIHLASHGLMDREQSKSMMNDAIFRIFSMTKPITVVALLTLFEQGLIRLIDPASIFLPAFGNLKVYDTNGGAEIILTDLKRPVTIRDLLTHTSGLTWGVKPSTFL